jgi:hypothetical protein
MNSNLKKKTKIKISKMKRDLELDAITLKKFKKFCLDYDPFTAQLNQDERELLQKFNIHLENIGPFEQTQVLLDKLKDVEHAT